MNSFKSIPASSYRSVALVAVLALLGSAQALADPEGTRSVKVGYGDLDLSTQAGAATLYQRIRGAAHQVCGSDGRSLADYAISRSCFNNAVSTAVATVNNPRLTALHQGKSPAVTAMLSK
ncbi:MAG TPA: UrcA family protein [Steroidobacteraceae bacterium]|jgi:UrcA family protein|nr:UrcA family protein [Steroidobacteraceae bacterium]